MVIKHVNHVVGMDLNDDEDINRNGRMNGNHGRKESDLEKIDSKIGDSVPETPKTPKTPNMMNGNDEQGNGVVGVNGVDGVIAYGHGNDKEDL